MSHDRPAHIGIQHRLESDSEGVIAMMTETVIVLETINEIRKTMNDQRYRQFLYELRLAVRDKAILYEAEQIMRKSKRDAAKRKRQLAARSVR